MTSRLFLNDYRIVQISLEIINHIIANMLFIVDLPSSGTDEVSSSLIGTHAKLLSIICKH
ncbi:hypothetical protein OUZ56_012891 [Daphnia magna]|uniref:Uncharacterized protein n=1 Tax=Daphnia magna TaxID=35525 RepID=A0ABQ9Z4B8_9CRUS|nr:hypothetical protein OUZ56_012891 [Daphnia magna]